VFSARIKYVGRGRPARVVQALCGLGLNGSGQPALPPLVIMELFIWPRRLVIFTLTLKGFHIKNFGIFICDYGDLLL